MVQSSSITNTEATHVEPMVSLRDALEQRQRTLQGELETLDRDIAVLQQELAQRLEQLKAKRQGIEEHLRHLRALFIHEGWAPKEEVTTHQALIAGTLQQSVRDAAVKMLETLGKPTHYRVICEKLLEHGVPINGKDPYATLLSHLARDQRFKHAHRRGVYALASWKVKAAKKRARRSTKAAIKLSAK